MKEEKEKGGDEEAGLEEEAEESRDNEYEDDDFGKCSNTNAQVGMMILTEI